MKPSPLPLILKCETQSSPIENIQKTCVKITLKNS